MHWILACAIELNGGRRRAALVHLSEVLGVSIGTVRCWVRGERAVPSDSEVAIRCLVEVQRLRLVLRRLREVLDEHQA